MDEEKLKLLKEKIAKSNKYILYVDYPDLLDLIKIIEKQQKEIEKLNFENHMVKKWNEQLDKNCISKDKIREKIKEIESYAFTSKEEKNQQDYAIERIRELLEEK